MNKAFMGRKKHRFFIPSWIVSLLIFAVIAVMIMAGIENMSQSANAEQLAAAERAVRKAAVLCYALEGRYPATLSYLEEHYGVQLNTDKYVYHYQCIGQNIMPQIAVFSADTEG